MAVRGATPEPKLTVPDPQKVFPRVGPSRLGDLRSVPHCGQRSVASVLSVVPVMSSLRMLCDYQGHGLERWTHNTRVHVLRVSFSGTVLANTAIPPIIFTTSASSGPPPKCLHFPWHRSDASRRVVWDVPFAVPQVPGYHAQRSWKGWLEKRAGPFLPCARGGTLTASAYFAPPPPPPCKRCSHVPLGGRIPIPNAVCLPLTSTLLSLHRIPMAIRFVCHPSLSPSPPLRSTGWEDLWR